MTSNNISAMKDIGIRVHSNCCPPTIAPLYTSFSRYSPHYKEEKNPEYNKNKPRSAENFPYRPVKDSVPQRLREALEEMNKSGEIDALTEKYGIE